MKAIITSIGERTTDLCVWSLERQGFEVILYKDGTSLANKLKRIYNDLNEDFVRVDADVICNRNVSEGVKELSKSDIYWWQGMTYGWFAQDVIYGGVQFIDKRALPDLRDNVDGFMNHNRPETQLSRIEEFHNPRRFDSLPMVFGIHGYKQTGKDIERVKKLKEERHQSANYDYELMERIEELGHD